MANKNNKVVQLREQSQMAEAPAPMTMQEAFMRSQEGFTSETVAQYVTEAPSRELFNRIEDIKEAMQRKVDQNQSELIFPAIFYFAETSQGVLDFFGDKGFEVGVNSNEDGKADVTLRW